EPQSISGDPAPGLIGALHDPLWLLGRQWQFREFHGEDAGTPVTVHINTETQRVSAWQPGDPGSKLPPRPLPSGEPLGPSIGREPPATAGPGLRQRAEAGATLVATLRDAGLDAGDALVKSHPLPTALTPPTGMPAEFWSVPPRYRVLARTCPDAE